MTVNDEKSATNENRDSTRLMADLVSALNAFQADKRDLHDEAQREMERYREFLEKLGIRTEKTIYVVAGVLLTIASFLGIRTYWDIEARLQQVTERQVERFVDRDLVSRTLDNEIQKHTRTALLASTLAVVLASPGGQPVPESGITAIEAALSTGSKSDLAQAIAIIEAAHESLNDHRHRLGAAAHNGFQYWRQGRRTDLGEAEVLGLVAALADLRYTPAIDILFETLRSNDLSEAAKMAVLAYVPTIFLTEIESADRNAQRLVELSHGCRQSSPKLYAAYLRAALRLSPSRAQPDLGELLATDSDLSRAVLQELVVSHFLPSVYTGVARRQEQRAISVVANLLIRKDVSMGLSDRISAGKLVPVLILFVHHPDEQARSGLSIADEVATRPLLGDAVATGFHNLEQQAVLSYFQRIAMPFLEYLQLSQKFDPEGKRTSGSLQARSFQREWLTITGLASERDRAVACLDKSGGVRSYKEIDVREIDWRTARWNPSDSRSVSTGEGV